CGLLIEADSYFNGKDVNTKKVNEDITIKGYCRNGDCKTNEAGINALTAYTFKKFKDSISRNSEYNKYDEWLLMWLSDKLLKMHLEIIGKKDKPGYIDGTTLNQAYDTYLKKHKVILDYWVLFDNIKGLKGANLKYMSEFYKLLNIICKTIVDYKDNGAESKKVSKNSISCLRQYRTLYMNIYECKSYLDLLNKLKGLYDDFRSYAIKRNGSKNNLETILQKLTLGNGTELEAVRKFKTYNFSNQKCYPQKKNTKPKKQDPPRLPPSSKEEPPPQPQKKDSLSPPPPSGQLKDSQHETPPSSQSSNVLPKTKGGGSSSSNVQDASKIGLKASDNSEGNTGGASGDTRSPKNENRGPDGGLNDNTGSGVKSNDGTSKRTDHADTSPPGTQTSNQEPDSENQGNVGGTTQSVQKSGGDTPKGTDGGTGNPGSVSGGGQDGKIGDSGSGGGGGGLGTGGEPASIQNDKGSSGGGTRGTSSVPDGQIPNGT
ncbi:Plasmodium variant antigen protein Cir/Yir/Bir, putative, partial [Plasmodium chabaudi adami]